MAKTAATRAEQEEKIEATAPETGFERCVELHPVRPTNIGKNNPAQIAGV